MAAHRMRGASGVGLGWWPPRPGGAPTSAAGHARPGTPRRASAASTHAAHPAGVRPAGQAHTRGMDLHMRHAGLGLRSKRMARARARAAACAGCGTWQRGAAGRPGVTRSARRNHVGPNAPRGHTALLYNPLRPPWLPAHRKMTVARARAARQRGQ